MELPQVIIVNERDEPVASMEKMEAHQRGFLHRAFSIFIFNSKGELLLQQRAAGKYHSGGLWTNTCCSHPQPGEETIVAAERRLHEEMGFTTGLEKLFDFIYKASFNNGLIEFEFDHVFAGEYDGPVQANKDEAMDYAFKSMEEIHRSIKQAPMKYSQWFRVALPRVEEWWRTRYSNITA
jgi:isopentenyl-diphosphate Delta-isomerase